MCAKYAPTPSQANTLSGSLSALLRGRRHLIARGLVVRRSARSACTLGASFDFQVWIGRLAVPLSAVDLYAVVAFTITKPCQKIGVGLAVTPSPP
jgi:hypothetical protein